MSPVKLTTVTITANAQYGTVSLDPPNPVQIDAGGVAFDLVVIGPGNAQAKAYLALWDHSKLAPDAGTLADSFQDVIFPLRDSGGNPLQPKFDVVAGQNGPVGLNLTVLFPQGQFVNQPVNSVVIIDW